MTDTLQTTERLKGSIEMMSISHPTNEIGNDLLIRALPPKRTRETVFAQNNVGFKGIKDPQDDTESIESIGAIRDMRFPLTYQESLYNKIDRAIRKSYSERNLRMIHDRYPIVVNGTDNITQNAMTDGDVGGCSGAGLCILGYSGTGKTTSLNRSLEDYPKLIAHNMENGSSFLQIPYIKVVCKNKYGMKALFDSFAEQIDIRLGNEFTLPYTNEMRKRRDTASKSQYACRLINILNIGMVIIDEIQNIDFERTHADSFAVWLGIVSETKVALCLVGTSDSYSLFGNDYQLARRIGDIIDTSRAARDKAFFNDILTELERHQYMIGYRIKLTPAIRETFYQETGGIIERMMYLWAKIQEDWVNSPADDKPIIDETYIRDTTAIHQELIQVGVHNLVNVIDRNDFGNTISTVNTIQNLSENDSIIIHDRSWIHDKAVSIICENNADSFFTRKTIEAEVRHQESLKRNIGKTAEEIAVCTMEALRKKKSDLRISKSST